MQPNPPTNTMTTTHPTPLSSSPAPAWTPGPWKAQHEFDFDPTYIMAANGLIVAASCCDDDAPQDPQEVLANARLIAAAPDMATVLREFIIQREMGLAHVEVLYEEARALLARINGHNPP